MGHLKLLLTYLSEHKVLIFFYFIVTILSYPLESIAIPKIYSYFFNTISKPGNRTISIFIKYFVILMVFLIIINIANSLSSYLDSIIIPGLNEYILKYLYKNLLIKYENEYTELELGKLINRVIFIPSNLKMIISETCRVLIPRGISIIVINLYFFYVNWKLGLISVFMLVAFFIINYIFLNKCGKISKSRYTEYEEHNQFIQDKLSNLASIYAFGNTQFEISKYINKLSTYISLLKSNLSCILTSSITLNILMLILFATLNSFSAYLFLKKIIGFTELMALFLIIIYYLPCITEINNSMPEIIQYYGGILQLDGFLTDLCNVNDNYEKNKILNSKLKCNIKSAIIDIKNLNFKYPITTKLLFNNFNLKINHLDKIAFTGPSGNGKSTLIKLIMGYYNVPNKTINIDNIDINDYDLSDLRSNISYVNQNTKLFNLTVLQNIKYGNNMTRKEVEQLCKKLGIEKIFENLDNGLDTIVGINGEKLSGGQRQMINILRCIGAKNKIVILDEPTSAIDKANTDAVIKALEEISKDCTLIIITHDEDILHLANRVIELNNGVIVKDIKVNDY